ncbi:Nucleolar GTP-binding protein 1, partial [Dimargaris xerosporica]
FADSLFRCKRLKVAALGRMGTIVKRQKDSLAYLEQVRQHLARLPSIDPNTRTLIICGYPNVGKSSFMNKVTRADVDVQPYAFTTKSLFVGHMDYKYLRWQVIDTPGILDHPLEDRNTIEMQSITALAHLRACVMFFIDLSEQCGYSIEDQVNLFNSIKPLFANKPTVLVTSKIDSARLEDLSEENQALVRSILSDSNVEMCQLSSHTEEGVMETRNRACDRLLSTRVEAKMKGQKINDVLNRLHLAQPEKRGDVERPPCIPTAVATRVKYDSNDPKRRRLERDLEAENGGAGVHSVDLQKHYLLRSDDWKYDAIPEIMNGKNVADFVDPQIEEQLEMLEREEERLVKEGFYESDEDEDGDSDDANGMVPSDNARIRRMARKIRDRKALMNVERRLRRSRSSAPMPQKVARRLATGDQLREHLEGLGIDEAISLATARSRSRRPAKRTRSPSRAESMARRDETSVTARAQSVVVARSETGVKNPIQLKQSERLRNVAQRPRNLNGRVGDADRSIISAKPRHLFAGKRKMGKTDRR